MRPVVGVCPLYDEERESFWMLPGYLEVLRACGALPLTLPLVDDVADVRQLTGMLDGVLLTGGHDIDPTLYGDERLAFCGPTLPARDRLEWLLLDEAAARDLPVLGICRGIQMLAVHDGGTLWQDLPTQLPSGVSHHMSAPYDRVAHEVTLVEGSPLRRLLGVGTLGVNSYHHQAVRSLGPGLSPMAFAPDGVVEAVWEPGRRFVWGVQWHPEFSWQADPRERAIVQAFVDACQA